MFFLEFFAIYHRNFHIFFSKMPHFKALDPLFWPLAQLLTRGPMVFEVWSKTSVQIIMVHPLFKLLFLYNCRNLALKKQVFVYGKKYPQSTNRDKQPTSIKRTVLFVCIIFQAMAFFILTIALMTVIVHRACKFWKFQI